MTAPELRAYLSQHEVSQRELARRLGVTPRHINKLVAGVSPITTVMAKAIRHTVECEIHD